MDDLASLTFTAPLVKKAIDYAFDKHVTECQQHYGEGDKHLYTHHLYNVHGVLERFGFKSEDMLAAGWLHDTVEDTSATVEEIKILFNDHIADIVYRVTNEPGVNRKERHEKTYPKIAASDDAITLKLADRIANVEYSIENKSDQLKMYKKEHAHFRSVLYKPGLHDPMWRHLDFLIGI